MSLTSRIESLASAADERLVGVVWPSKTVSALREKLVDNENTSRIISPARETVTVSNAARRVRAG